MLVLVVGGVGLACFQHKMCWEQSTHTGLVLPSERRQPSWPPPSGAVCRGESRAWLGSMCRFASVFDGGIWAAAFGTCFRTWLVAFCKLGVTWIPQGYM